MKKKNPPYRGNVLEDSPVGGYCKKLQQLKVMKQLTTLPSDRGFFDVYAKLAKSIRASGFFAQVVSGATEIGIIFSASLNSLMGIFPAIAPFAAIVIALIGTAVIEVGLRVLAPHSIDAILYKRFGGLHLPMTIAIWLLTIILLGTSGILSFKNSDTIVENFTPEAEEQTTDEADSTYGMETDALREEYQLDSITIAKGYETQLTGIKLAYDKKIGAARQKLQGYTNREARTGNSFATWKDRTKETIANLEAEQAAQLAGLETQRSAELTEARQEYKAALAVAKVDYSATVDSVLAMNRQAITKREETISQYGGGLGWFTIICLFIFVSSVVLDRIHRKGSGIEEKVEVSQYDFSPGIWANFREAVRERFNYAMQSRIKDFADATPPAPLPTNPAQLYDATQVANITVTLKLDQRDSDEENVIYIEPKRRQIGFTQRDGNVTKNDVETHQNSRAIKDTGKDPDLWKLKQRLKDYKKRLGSFEQKKLAAERKGQKVSKRTLSAIENNRQWVEHYIQLINEAEAATK